MTRQDIALKSKEYPFTALIAAAQAYEDATGKKHSFAASVLGHFGGRAGRGAAKRRGGKAYYRRIQKLSAAARAQRRAQLSNPQP